MAPVAESDEYRDAQRDDRQEISRQDRVGFDPFSHGDNAAARRAQKMVIFIVYGLHWPHLSRLLGREKVPHQVCVELWGRSGREMQAILSFAAAHEGLRHLDMAGHPDLRVGLQRLIR
jgi:hypothetical protein